MPDKGPFGHTGGKLQWANTGFLGIKRKTSAIKVAADKQKEAEKGFPSVMVNEGWIT